MTRNVAHFLETSIEGHVLIYFGRPGLPRSYRRQPSLVPFRVTTIVHMDRASQALAQGLPPDAPRTWAALPSEFLP